MKYLISILLIAVLGACSSGESGAEKYTDEISKIDQYSKQLKVEVDQFMALDSNKIKQIPADYDEMKRVMTSYYTPDTIEPHIANRINLFKSLKDMKHYAVNKKRFMNAADLTFEQLNNLKLDLENNSLDEKIDLKEAMALESKGAEEIIGVLNSYTELLTKNLALYDSLNPQVQNIVDSLRSLHE